MTDQEILSTAFWGMLTVGGSVVVMLILIFLAIELTK